MYPTIATMIVEARLRGLQAEAANERLAGQAQRTRRAAPRATPSPRLAALGARIVASSRHW
jgi:hypothetical protein